MGETPSKLFHAIVGIGLAAAGCGDVLSGSDDASPGERRPDGMHGRMGDAATTAHPDATSVVDALADTGVTVLLDAMTMRDSGVDVEVQVDAARAHDAALDVTRPPPPEIK